MDTRQYDSKTRKSIKRFQRSPGYRAVKALHVERMATAEVERKRIAKDLNEQKKLTATLERELAQFRGEAP
jgi:hypothetical protein